VPRQDVAREAHGGVKSLLASRLRPLSRKATHPPNYRSLPTHCHLQRPLSRNRTSPPEPPPGELGISGSPGAGAGTVALPRLGAATAVPSAIPLPTSKRKHRSGAADGGRRGSGGSSKHAPLQPGGPLRRPHLPSPPRVPPRRRRRPLGLHPAVADRAEAADRTDAGWMPPLAPVAAATPARSTSAAPVLQGGVGWHTPTNPPADGRGVSTKASRSLPATPLTHLRPATASAADGRAASGAAGGAPASAARCTDAGGAESMTASTATEPPAPPPLESVPATPPRCPPPQLSPRMSAGRRAQPPPPAPTPSPPGRHLLPPLPDGRRAPGSAAVATGVGGGVRPRRGGRRGAAGTDGSWPTAITPTTFFGATAAAPGAAAAATMPPLPACGAGAATSNRGRLWPTVVASPPLLAAPHSTPAWWLPVPLLATAPALTRRGGPMMPQTGARVWAGPPAATAPPVQPTTLPLATAAVFPPSLDGGRPRPGPAVRAIPTTSAPSHIRYTLCHEAETCLFIKEMGPLGFSVNVIDPILAFNGHDGILEVRDNSEAQKWGGRWTCPIREAKWGRSGVGPNAFCALIGGV